MRLYTTLKKCASLSLIGVLYSNLCNQVKKKSKEFFQHKLFISWKFDSCLLYVF